MSNKHVLIILDLDGVLITTPPWKKDDLDTDGYSAFNPTCVTNFNKLLDQIEGEIWLSSSRRTTKTVEQFNEIFGHRKIKAPIAGFIPKLESRVSRKEEIERFLELKKPECFIIIDDDKSLNNLSTRDKSYWIHTQLLLGFRQEELENTLNLLKSS